jgi:hypothetical protein
MTDERLLLCAWPAVLRGPFPQPLCEQIAYELTSWSQASTGFQLHAGSRPFAESLLRFIQEKNQEGAARALLQGKVLTREETAASESPVPALWPAVRAMPNDANVQPLRWSGEFSDMFRMVRLRLREIARKEGHVLDVYPNCSWDVAFERSRLMWLKNAVQAARHSAKNVCVRLGEDQHVQVGGWEMDLQVPGAEGVFNRLVHACATFMPGRLRTNGEREIWLDFQG